ncbi:MAG: PSD1 domain-containing protein [Verrucomicrobia bacterium]|nr:PSD1 domain-containing protein [Verrucomicrobiota bacterium]
MKNEAEIRRPKVEGRRKSEDRNPKLESNGFSAFGFRPSFGLRVSAFGLVLVTSIASASPINFNRDIRPILSDRCFACHGPEPAKRQAGLRLDLEEGVHGPLPKHPDLRAFVPGKPAQSRAYQRITSANPDEQMPPAKSNLKLNDAEKALFKRWIEEGAKWQPHWAFVKPERPALPEIRNPRSEIRNPIDNFIAVRLAEEQLSPSPEADKATLLRRVSLDLTGIPPTPAEVDAFLADKSTDAYERAVDRLLASPRYGEQMALRWLDYARYADSHGYQADWERFMWRWRDWVVGAFNANLPFDQFTIEQLAGDLLPNPTVGQRIATGFNRNHRINTEGGIIAEEWRVETVVDRVDTTSAVWLGLTMGCARCHDHKYDPFTQKEYYRLAAFFNNVDETGIGDEKLGNVRPVLKLPAPEQQKRLDELAAQIKEAEAKYNEAAKAKADPKKDKAAQKAKQELDKLQAEHRLLDMRTSTMVMEELPQPRDTFLLIRGQYDKRGEKVDAGLPAALPPMPAGAPTNRLGLAQWIVDPANPLTARVLANRLWEKFFGAGLVKTTENLGSQAEWPSHPELLDWLATELVRLKWDLKAFQKMIVMSATYRQSSCDRLVAADVRRRASAVGQADSLLTSAATSLYEIDPENRLLARAPRLRLPAETVRDQALAVSGLLVEKLGGPSVKPYMPAGLWDEVNVYGNLRVYVADKGEGLYRRTLYTFYKRTAAPPDSLMFDVPGREICAVKRSRTNTPLQALALLNEITYVEAARALAERMLAEGGATPAERINFAFRRAAGRVPNEAEAKLLRAGFERQLERFRKNGDAATKLLSVGEMKRNEKLDVAELAAATMTARVILNLDETVTRQ